MPNIYSTYVKDPGVALRATQVHPTLAGVSSRDYKKYVMLLQLYAFKKEELHKNAARLPRIIEEPAFVHEAAPVPQNHITEHTVNNLFGKIYSALNSLLPQRNMRHGYEVAMEEGQNRL